MSKGTYGHVLVLPSQRLVCLAADDDFEMQLLNLEMIDKLQRTGDYENPVICLGC